VTERGSAPIELVLGIGLLLLPVVVTVLAFVPVLERRSLAGALAAQTASLVAIGHPVDEALALLEEDAAFAGIPAEDLGVGLCAPVREPGVVVGGCEPEAGGVVSVTVLLTGPAVPTPFGVVGGGPISVTRVQPVDRHRSLP
jgi:hypothetical protein